MPGIIHPGTLFYHGREDQNIPHTEWVSNDPEHSSIFCRMRPEPPPGPDHQGCWQLTVAAARTLNIVYFDGSSAAKMFGSLDIQDLIAWGEVDDDYLYAETQRLVDLCKWGEKFGIDGFVR